MILETILIITTPIFAFGWLRTNKKKKLLELEYNIKIARTLGNASLLRDHETEAHNLRVAYLSVLLAQKLNLSQKQLQSLMKGAFLHDIGKIGIPDNILLKNGKLNENEWKIMKQHPALGKKLVDQMPWFEDAIEMILYHHEKFDGTGYPYGLKGNNIPLNARIFSIIDVFDALVSERPYKKAMSVEDAIEIINYEKNSHFDPELVDIFCENIKNIHDKVYNCSENQLQNMLIEKRKNIFGL